MQNIMLVVIGFFLLEYFFLREVVHSSNPFQDFLWYLLCEVAKPINRLKSYCRKIRRKTI